MKKSKYEVLHIMPYDKFTESVIKKNRKCFPDVHMIHWVYGYNVNTRLLLKKATGGLHQQDVRLVSDYNPTKELFRLVLRANKIVIHYMPEARNLLRFFAILQPLIGRKYCWMMWGGDIPPIKDEKDEKIRKFLIENLRQIAYVCYSDYEKIRKYYNIKKSTGYRIVYPYDLLINKSKSVNTTIKIGVLNSATETCRHIDAFEKLAKYKNCNIEIICILSYPDNKAYIRKVIEKGTEIFGSKFKPITSFLTYEDYQELLNSFDIAILNNNRQQGGGNLNNLLYMGTLIYLSPDNGYYEEYKKDGFIIFNMNELDVNKVLSEEEKQQNRKLIRYFMSDQYYRKVWGKVYKDNL